MKEKTYIVYCHTNKLNGKRYIGATSQTPAERWGRDGKKYTSGRLKKAIDKYGWDSFEHKVLFTGLDKQTARSIERKLIEKYDTTGDGGYNTTAGGEDCLGREFTKESRRKMSESARNRTDSREKSAEYREERSRICKERHQTISTRPAVKLIDSDGRVYESVRDASIAIGMNYHTLWNQIKGRRKNKSGLRIYE